MCGGGGGKGGYVLILDNVMIIAHTLQRLGEEGEREKEVLMLE